MLCFIVGLIGSIWLVQKIYQSYKLIASCISEQDLKKIYGNGWVLVTGATDGIGKGFCEVLAKKGFNLVVFGRNPEKTNLLCKELEKNNIKAKPLIADFSHCMESDSFITVIKSNLKKIIGNDKVSMLVNNVGVEKTLGQRAKTMEWLTGLVAVNVASQVQMVKLVLDEYMKEKNTEKKAIINVSSITADFVVPLDCEYSASKTFNDKFSQSLHYELEEDNIDVLSVKPYWVQTKLTRYRKAPFAITPEMCATGSLNSLGKVRATYGHLQHNIVGIIQSLLPREFIAVKIRGFYKKCIAINKKKDAEQKKQE